MPIMPINDMRAVASPEVLVAFANKKFDSQGNYVDEEGRKFLRQLLVGLLELTLATQRARLPA